MASLILACVLVVLFVLFFAIPILHADTYHQEDPT